MRRIFRFLAVLMLAGFGACFAQNVQEPGISKLEPYLGMNRAVAETLAQVKAGTPQNHEEVEENKSAELCEDVAFRRWTKSSHPGGNKLRRDGDKKFNEENDGVGFKCYTSRSGTLRKFVHVDMLHNSKHGGTLSVGFGWEADLLKAGPINAYAGISASLTHYEVKGRLRIGPNNYLYKRFGDFLVPHPSFHYGVGLDIKETMRLVGVSVPFKLGTISAQENNLLGKARIRSIGWEYRAGF